MTSQEKEQTKYKGVFPKENDELKTLIAKYLSNKKIKTKE